ncbi:MAG: Ig-like domain-containing protein [Candidatus Hatepunaea meridiana]|nr:Ig-like domain-containing protein [Candidatus Hatepunaea meridiana]
MGSPSGGPEDKEPPLIINVIPASGATNVDPESDIEFTFSERVDRASLIEALFITPPPEKQPKVKINGQKVHILLHEPIPFERTLVVSIGASVMDLRRNKLEESFAVALTAGETIDEGRITGSVFAGHAAQGMLVAAWIVSDSLEIDPTESPPEYMTQAGVDGGFVLDYLPAGTYRIACWEDKKRDRLYDPATDMLGLPWRDVILEKDSETRIEIYPSKRDTSETRLFIVSASDERHIELRFNKILDRKLEEIIPKLGIRDTVSTLSIKRAWFDAVDSSRIVLYTEMQNPDREYLLEFAGDTTLYYFNGSAIPDTIGPRITASFPKSMDRDVSELPSGWIGFDDAIIEDEFDIMLSLTLVDSSIIDSTAFDSIEFPVHCRFNGANLLWWELDDPLLFGREYTLSFDMNRIQDIAGNRSPDTTWSVSFTILDPTETGSITGMMLDNDFRWVVVARSIDRGNPIETHNKVKTDGSFNIERLNAGKYIIWAYIDRDRNDMYSYGKLLPFSFAERFTVSPDTITVRERWENSGVKIEIR